MTMKKTLSILTLILSTITGSLAYSQESTVDTVVVGQPYYGGYYPGSYGGYYGGYNNPNPVLQGGGIGGNPFYLGSQVYLNRGSTTRGQVGNAFRQSGNIFLTPNPVNTNVGYFPNYPGTYNGYPIY